LAPQALAKGESRNWIHPLSDIITGLLEAGLALSWLHEHACLPWRMFQTLVKDHEGMYRWPDKPWLPLAFSLKARRPHGPRAND
jgi:hypothetical protein